MEGREGLWCGLQLLYARQQRAQPQPGHLCLNQRILVAPTEVADCEGEYSRMIMSAAG
jgi:hypothetical protein